MSDQFKRKTSGGASTRRPVPRWRDLGLAQKFERLWAWITILLMMVGCFSYVRGDRLIDSLPISWYAIAFALGIANGLELFIFALFIGNMAERSPKQYFLLSVTSGVMFSIALNYVVEMYEFSGTKSNSFQILAPVTGRTGCGAGRNLQGPTLNVQPYPNSRNVSVSVNFHTCDLYEANRRNNNLCFLLDVETGRNGFRRVVVPTIWPMGEDRLRTCAVQ